MRNLKPFLKLANCARLSSTFTLSDLKHQYPLVIGPKSRLNHIEKRFPNLPIWERLLAMPFRGIITKMVTNQYINQRFRDSPDETYMPDEFLNGAKFAIKDFFDRLSKKDPEALKGIVSEQLYTKFHDCQTKLDNTALHMDINLMAVSRFEVGEVWLTSGDMAKYEKLCKRKFTTLNKAPILDEAASLIYWRNNPKEKVFLFTEVNYEYVFFAEDLEVDGESFELPTIQQRRELTRMGSVLGIDVTFDVDFTIEISSKVDSSVKVFAETVKRPMNFRLETSYFSGRYEGKWKIADIDNYFASRVLEPN